MKRLTPNQKRLLDDLAGIPIDHCMECNSSEWRTATSLDRMGLLVIRGQRSVLGSFEVARPEVPTISSSGTDRTESNRPFRPACNGIRILGSPAVVIDTKTSRTEVAGRKAACEKREERGTGWSVIG